MIRRVLIGGVGIGGACAVYLTNQKAEPVQIKQSDFVITANPENPPQFKSTHDVIVVGSGAAGCSSALSARLSGKKRVVVLEKESKLGGTTGKSGGIFWVPNNPLMQEDGLTDKKDDFMKYACKASYPDAFDERKNFYGLESRQYRWLEKFYDEGKDMVDEMKKAEICSFLSRFTKIDGTLMTDYFYTPEQEPLNKSPNGRALGIGSDKETRDQFQWLSKQIEAAEGSIRSVADSAIPALKDLLLVNTFGIDLSYGVGVQMIAQFEKILKQKQVEMRVNSGVASVVEEDGRVVGVQLLNGDLLKANDGVVFATGGFSQDQEMCKKYNPNPVYMTGAARGATGDFHKMAQELGAELSQMDKIWGCQTWLEQSFKQWEDEVCLFQVRGDSFVMVNKEGKRVVNEKWPYDKRVRVHWEQTADGEQPNRYLFLIGDERCVLEHGANFAKTWPADRDCAFYIKGNSVPELAEAIKERLASIEDKVGPYPLAPDFASKLNDTIQRFNGYAETGVDLEFNRGKASAEREWTVSPRNDKPNVTMYPMDVSGENPLYCLILAPSMIDTKGGPVTNTVGQVLREDGSAIPGLYAAGNAAAPISGDAYWSGGATLGTALFSGWVAGKTAGM